MTSGLKSISLVFAGGGTGGHLFPALAIAQRVGELAGESCQKKIVLVGTVRGIEYRLRESLSLPLQLIDIRGMARRLAFSNLAVPFLVVKSLWQSRALLKAHRPDLVVGTGGYVCWPVLRMAAMMGITTVLQEQNSYPGVVTRQLAGSAARIYLGFDEARQFLPNTTPIVTTGNPVRKSVLSGDRRQALEHFKLDPARRTVLVLGGSQGARSINAAISKSLWAGSLERGYQLLWQTGEREFNHVAGSLGSAAQGHVLFPFEQRMDLVYAAADMVIARSGAISLAEIEAGGLPALLIPYPHAAGDHQRMNAKASVSRGFAEVINPDDLDSIDLLAQIVAMDRDGRIERMRQTLRQHTVGRKPAVDVIAEDIIRLVVKAQEARVDR
ncbi:MAG: undecaprenyldiphospho-muramoylpentapeptide beta-N-acetylglucosaminyltransferase [Candidatus Zixiibacteriota bacterium]